MLELIYQFQISEIIPVTVRNPLKSNKVKAKYENPNKMAKIQKTLCRQALNLITFANRPPLTA